MSMTVDTTDFDEAMRRARLTESDLLNIAGAGAAVLVNGMRTKVPVDTGATRASIMSHIVSASNTKIEDDIGPETNYAPYLEYGTKRMRAQSFVRPAAYENLIQVVSAISQAYAAWASNL